MHGPLIMPVEEGCLQKSFKLHQLLIHGVNKKQIKHGCNCYKAQSFFVSNKQTGKKNVTSRCV